MITSQSKNPKLSMHDSNLLVTKSCLVSHKFCAQRTVTLEVNDIQGLFSHDTKNISYYFHAKLWCF